MTPSTMTTLRRLASRYVSERVKARTLAPKTAENTRFVLITFCEIAPPEPAEVKPRHVAKWAGSRSLAPSTLRNRISIVRSFCRWLILHDHIERDPTAGFVSPKEPVRMPRALLADDVGRVLAHCPDARGRLIVSLMVELGLRRAEVTSIQMGDIDFRAGLLLVHGKGSRDRWLPLTASARAALTTYLAEYPATTGPLLRSYIEPRQALQPRYVGDMVREWMVAAGVKQAPGDGVSAHALRHTAASDVFDRGADIRSVQAMLGHVTLSTTQRYLRRPDAGKLLEVMEGRVYEEGRTDA